MSVGVSQLRGPVPAAGRAGPAPAARDDRGRRLHEPLLDPVTARVVTLLALIAFGAVHWMLMVVPAAGGRALATVAICSAATGLLVLARRLGRLPRAALVAVTIVAGMVLSALAGGIPADLLEPRNWDELGAIVRSGTSALPGARVPYAGLDEQLRLVIPLGGTLLALLGTLLACWPRRGGRFGYTLPALVALVTLYAVPAVSLIIGAEFLRGALLALLVLAFLRLHRLRRRDATAALGVAGGAAVLALAAAPALDTADPWFDYEAWAQDAAGANSTAFNWSHSYGVLSWPRDGRELLRIESRQRSYWKVDDLDVFDGRRWTVLPGGFGRNHSGVLFGGVTPDRFRDWSFDVRVSVRALRSELLPLAGSAGVVDFPQRVASQLRTGVWTVGRPIRRGDAYQATVYLPQPSSRELATAGTEYSLELIPYTSFETVPAGGAPGERPVPVWTPGFYGAEPVLAPRGRVPAADVLEGGSLRRIWRLSQRLRAQSRTPYEYLRAVERYLDDGFRYDEAPPNASRTLDGFLFDTKAGFCQHYSGAMALLLRMGGIPARVATGFAPGSYDRRSKQYVVRDLDAHSWVEAFFPHIGWVTFDPTPAAAPPRSQALSDAASAASGDERDLGTTQVTTPKPFIEPKGGGTPWVAIAGAGLAVALLAGLGRWALVRHRRPRTGPVTELERALRSAGVTVPPGATLQALEARLRRWPAAVEYVAALRAQRFGAGAAGPTAAQRRGLRRALGHGRGPLARARTWAALPPRLRHPGRPRTPGLDLH